MNVKSHLVICCALLSAAVSGFEAKQQGKTVIVSGKRIEISVCDARIAAIRNRENGAVLTSDQSISMYSAGLGRMTGQAKELSRVHFPWGEPNLSQRKERKPTSIYGQAGERTKMSVKPAKDRVSITWQGLYYGKDFAADDSITLEFSEDANGALEMQRSGRGRDGVFGLSVPVDHLAPDGKLFLPSFGGMEYAAVSNEGREELIGLQDTVLFIEAPVMIYVRNRNAFGMWVEDSTFRPYFGLIERNPKGSAFTLEGLNLIPYEKLTSAAPPAVKFDVFKDSGWISAARPYRNWYQKTFAKEIAIRDNPKSWANDIMVIADGGNSAPGYDRLPKFLDPKTVLVQVWQARKLGFTVGIPDYTPRGHYPDVVKQVHQAGMKVMCYVCPLCAVYLCDAWKQDKVGDFFLTRKNSITNYNGNKNAFDENLAGTIRAAKGKDQFGHLKPGAFLYGDPLSRGWREYFANKIKTMNDLCGTDANYQDTLGCTADVGNGVIEGLSGAQGNAEFARYMQQKVPGVPMAAEFGPAPIAFAINWPLNLARAWGGAPFRKYRVPHQVPLTPFLFGYRTWVSSNRMYNDEISYTVLSVSDALSGFAFLPTSINPEIIKGFSGQMVLRAKLFSSRMLRPYYPEKEYPENIRAMYQDKEGKIYHYYNDGKLQKMMGPDGKAFYGRMHGMSELRSAEFFLPGHPIWDENGIYSLNPKNYYPLVPRREVELTAVRGNKLPEGVFVRSYYERPDYAYLELDSTVPGRDVSADFVVDPKFSSMIVNGREMPCSGKVTLSGKLPVKAIFFNGKEQPAKETIFVNWLSGMMEGEAEALRAPRKINGQLMYFIPTQYKRLVNTIMKVPSKNSAVQMSLINLQKRFGDGAIVELWINGSKVRSFDCAKWNGKGRKDENQSTFDNRMRTWTEPVGKYAGQFIFVTVAVDYKNGSNGDSQFVSLPALVEDPAQKSAEKITKMVDRQIVRPKGEPVEVIEPTWKNGSKKEKGSLFCDKFIPLDPAKIYYLSGEFKSVDGNPVRVHLGMVEWDEKGQIHGVHVNNVPKSETMVNQEAKAGAKFIYVFDATKWSPKGMVALGAAKDGSDLPNRNLIGPIEKIELTGGDYKVTLKNPLKNDIPSETPARCHIPRGTFEYVPVVTAKADFAKTAGRISVLPKAKRGRVIIISPAPVEFRNIKLEVFDRPGKN